MEKWRRIWMIVAVIFLITMLINEQPVEAQTTSNGFSDLGPGTYKGKITFEVVETTAMNQQGVIENSVVSFSQYEGTISIYVNKLQASPSGSLSKSQPAMNVETNLYAIQGYYTRMTDAQICRMDWYADSTFYVAKNKAFDVLNDEGFGSSQKIVLPITIKEKKPVWQNTFTTSCPAPDPPSKVEANTADWLRSLTAWFPSIELTPTEGSDLYISGTCDFQTPKNPTLGWNGQGITGGVSWTYHTVNCHWSAIESNIRNRWMNGSGKGSK